MSWFRRKLTEDQKAVQVATEALDKATNRRRSALRRLVSAIDAISLENGLSGLGATLAQKNDPEAQ